MTDSGFIWGSMFFSRRYVSSAVSSGGGGGGVMNAVEDEFVTSRTRPELRSSRWGGSGKGEGRKKERKKERGGGREMEGKEGREGKGQKERFGLAYAFRLRMGDWRLGGLPVAIVRTLLQTSA